MKILIIDESINRVGGVERVISTLANKLCDNNEVFVLSEYKSSDKPFYMYNKNVKIKYLIDSQKYITNRLKSKNLKYYIFRAIEKVRDTIILNRKIKEEVCKLNDFDLIIFGRVFTALDFFRNVKRKINSKVIVRDAIHLEYYTKKIEGEIRIRTLANSYNLEQVLVRAAYGHTVLGTKPGSISVSTDGISPSIELAWNQEDLYNECDSFPAYEIKECSE